jgi:hypothetical protein
MPQASSVEEPEMLHIVYPVLMYSHYRDASNQIQAGANREKGSGVVEPEKERAVGKLKTGSPARSWKLLPRFIKITLQQSTFLRYLNSVIS